MKPSSGCTKLMPTQRVVVGVHARLHGLKAQQRLRKDLLRRIAAQNLVDVANLHLAGGRGLRRSAVLNLAPQRLGRAHILAIRGDLVAQARSSSVWRNWAKSGFQPISWAICAAWPKGGVSISSRYCWFCAAARLATSSTHSPMCCLFRPAKAVEGGKKLVVPAEAGRGHKAAHGEGVDQPVVEILVGRKLSPESARCRYQLPLAWRLGKVQRHRVHAQPVLAGVADKGLGIHRAGKMNVQVGALGKLVQKRAQRQRPLARYGSRRRVRRALRPATRACERGQAVRQQDEAGEKAGKAAHIAFQCRAGAGTARERLRAQFAAETAAVRLAFARFGCENGS